MVEYEADRGQTHDDDFPVRAKRFSFFVDEQMNNIFEGLVLFL